MYLDKEEMEMKKYRITFTETSYGEIHVEAENEEQAMELAEKAYENGEYECGDMYADLSNPEEE
jgi:hypothetical protein